MSIERHKWQDDPQLVRLAEEFAGKVASGGGKAEIIEKNSVPASYVAGTIELEQRTGVELVKSPYGGGILWFGNAEKLAGKPDGALSLRW